MTRAGDRLIGAAKEAARIADEQNRREVDREMLRSMATSFRADLPFSFNRFDMADLLDRAASRFTEPQDTSQNDDHS